MKNLKSQLKHSFPKLQWIGLTLLFLGLFSKLTWELHEDAVLDSLDKNILFLISKFRVSWLNGPAVDLTALGSPTILALLTLIGMILLWLNKDKRGVAYLFIGSAGAGILTSLIKNIFERPRPEVVPKLVEVNSYSYPSGHSVGATSFYLLLMFLVWRVYTGWEARLTLFLCTSALIAAVSLSRLYLGVHFPSDVLSGILLGAAWVCILTAFFPFNRQYKK